MAQYLLAVHTDFDPARAPDPATMQQRFDSVDAFNAEVMAEGSWVFGGGLQPPTSATVVRTEGGHTTMTDGPYAETKEVLGGFWIVDVADLDQALELARRGSTACGGPVEVRPFQDMPES